MIPGMMISFEQNHAIKPKDVNSGAGEVERETATVAVREVPAANWCTEAVSSWVPKSQDDPLGQVNKMA